MQNYHFFALYEIGSSAWDAARTPGNYEFNEGHPVVWKWSFRFDVKMLRLCEIKLHINGCKRYTAPYAQSLRIAH